MNDYLYRLTMQGKTAFRGLLQSITSEPRALTHASGFVLFHAQVPDLRRFPLGVSQALELGW